jgi:hypothetical protein
VYEWRNERKISHEIEIQEKNKKNKKNKRRGGKEEGEKKMKDYNKKSTEKAKEW